MSRLILFHQSLWILLLPPPPPPPPSHPSPSLLNSQIHLLNFRVLISQEFEKFLYLSPVFIFAFSIFFFLPLRLLSVFSLSIYNFLSWAIAPLSLYLHPICFLLFFNPLYFCFKILPASISRILYLFPHFFYSFTIARILMFFVHYLFLHLPCLLPGSLHTLSILT